MRPLADINGEIAVLETQLQATPIASVNADGVSVVNPLRVVIQQRLDQLYEQQRQATLTTQDGSNGNPVNGRWERARVTGIGTV